MRFVKSDKPVTTNHGKLGEISIEVEVPECESWDEVATFCGGTSDALAYVNAQIATSAKNGGRAALRALPDDASLDDARAKIQAIVKEYAPQSGGDRQPGKAKKAAAFDRVDALLASGKEFTREELLAELALAR